MSDKVVRGDCLDVMKRLPDACVDAIVTDPPYGLSFMGRNWDHGVPGPAFWIEALRVAKPGAHLVAFGGTRTFHRLACAIEDAGWEIRDCLSWLYGSGFPKSLNVQQAINKAARGFPQGGPDPTSPNHGKFKGGCTEESPAGRGFGAGAAAFMEEMGSARGDDEGPWNGWGTALKPAWEPIILARKPLVGTVAANVLAHGTGAINVDGCRIGTEGGGTACNNRDSAGRCLGHNNAGRSTSGPTVHGPDTSGGRWPANVALDEEAAAMLDEQTGVSVSRASAGRNGRDQATATWGLNRCEDKIRGHNDSGGASRFFYTAKASRRERGEGNTHPTVKSLSLMRWLVRLVTPKGGNVLDPFAGSGTTLLAAHLEGFDYLGIEREAEYVEIIRRRLERVEDLR